MKIPPTGYLRLALPFREPVCVIVRAFTDIFLPLLAGIAAGIGSVVAAILWED
jgi:hypothetical protein